MTSECVRLRCQVTMSSLSLEKKSRKTSESGNMAPIIKDHVMMRPRFIGCPANISSPRKTAFPINAPAMPCVIVSIVRFYPMRPGRGILTDEQKRICFGDDFADTAGGDVMTIEGGDGGLCGFRQDSNQKAAGSLRVEEKITVFLRNAVGETHAIANEIAVILQAAGEKSFARSLPGSGKIANGGMIDLEGHGFDSAGRVTKRHLPSVA